MCSSQISKGWNVTTRYRHNFRKPSKKYICNQNLQGDEKNLTATKESLNRQLHLVLCAHLIATNQMSWRAHLGFESQGQSKLGGLVNSLGIYLSRNCEKWLWSPLMLNQGTHLAKVVNSCLHCGERVQWMLSASGYGILIGREAVRYLPPNSCGSQRPHRMVVRCIQSLTLVIPTRNDIAHHVMDGRTLENQPEKMIMHQI